MVHPVRVRYRRWRTVLVLAVAAVGLQVCAAAAPSTAPDQTTPARGEGNPVVAIPLLLNDDTGQNLVVQEEGRRFLGARVRARRPLRQHPPRILSPADGLAPPLVSQRMSLGIAKCMLW